MKRILAFLMAAALLALCAACGEKAETGPETLSIDEATIVRFAEIACRSLEDSKLLSYREAFLSRHGDAVGMPAVSRAIEVRLSKDDRQEEMHFYLMHISAAFLNSDEFSLFDGFNVVYDCDTDTLLGSYTGWVDFNSFPEYSREYYQHMGLYLGMLEDSFPLEGNWSAFQGTEAHAAFDETQLAALNDLLEPQGWYAREEVIIPMGEDGEPLPNAVAPEVGSSFADPVAVDLTGINEADIVTLSAEALRACHAAGAFQPGELTTLTVLKGARYTCSDVLPDGSGEELLLLWLDADRERFDIFAGQVAVDMSTGTALTLAGFSEEAINYDTREGLLRYYFWTGCNAREETGTLMNETEQITYFTPEECTQINALLGG